MKLPAFEYACPATLSEAVALLASHEGDAKAIAGGQSLVPMLAVRLAPPSLLVDLRNLAGLDRITITQSGGRLRGLVCPHVIEGHARLGYGHPLAVAAT